MSNIQSRVNNLEESLAHMEAPKLAFADHIDQGIEEWKTSFLVGLTESFDKQLKATHALAEQALALALAKDKKANNPDDAADVDAQKPAGVGNEGSVMGVGKEDNPSAATSLNVASGTRAVITFQKTLFGFCLPSRLPFPAISHFILHSA